MIGRSDGSLLVLRRRCKYMCYIEEEEGQPLFKVKVVEKGHDDLILTGPTPKGNHHLCVCTDCHQKHCCSSGARR